MSPTLPTPPEPARRLSIVLAVTLTVGSGAMDAIGFARLGDVFTSVMTGNLVLLGISAGNGNGALAFRIGIAFAAFTVGVMTSGRICKRHVGETNIWPRGVTHCLAVQLVVLAAFVALWQVEDARPEGGPQDVLLVLAALAMGLQSGAVVSIGIQGLSTTYVTGTLTGVLTTVANSRKLKFDSAAILVGLVVGACAAGLLLVHAPRFAPVLPLVVLITVLAIAWRTPVFKHHH